MTPSTSTPISFGRLGRLCIAMATLGLALLGPVHAQDAAALKARHAASKERLATNQFGRPLFLESTQNSGELKGDVYSVVQYPFAMVSEALKPVGHWCDILILHLNVKGCKAQGAADAATLSVAAGKKFDQPLEDAYKLNFNYKVGNDNPDYLQVLLNADEGPFGTRNYRILLEATPIDAGKTFVHMSYASTLGMMARTAMQAYLATVGSAKVGFTPSNEKGADGKPGYVGGVLGLTERNTMRYYLAIDAYLASYGASGGDKMEKSLQTWYDATERYATQLHEMEKDEYMEMKHKEVRRQREGK